MEALTLTRVYAVHGKLTHLLRPGDVTTAGDALCRHAPSYLGWRGTGSRLEYEVAAALPLCSRCLYLSAESHVLPGAGFSAAPGVVVPARFTEGVSARAPGKPGAASPPGRRPGALSAASPPAPPGDAAAKPAEPVPPSGEAGKDAPEGHAPVTPGAQAGLSPSPTPGDRPAPGPAGEGRIGGVSPAAGRTWTIELPAGMPLVSLNHREHWAARNRKARGLKDAAIALARQAKIPPLERIRVTVLFDPPDRRKRDHDNLWPVAKHLTDGLVIAGVVPNDTPEYVAPGHVEVTGTVHPRGRLRMIITDLGGEAA